MKDFVSSLSLSVIDFVGAFLPGLSIVMLSVCVVKYGPFPRLFSDILPMGVLLLLDKPDNPITLLTVFLLSILIGYSLKGNAMWLGEKCTEHVSFILHSNLKAKISSDKYKFPFDNYFRQCDEHHYFNDKNDKVKDNLLQVIERHIKNDFHVPLTFLLAPASMKKHKLDDDNNHLFSYCKRIIKVVAPALAVENDSLEAEVRMAGSFFLVSGLGFIVSLLIVFYTLCSQAFTDHNYLRYDTFWLIACVIFLGASIMFANVFNGTRLREVSYVYLNFLVCVGISQKVKST